MTTPADEGIVAAHADTTREQKQQLRSAVAKSLQDQHPELTPNTGNALIVAAKNLRVELKAAFTGVKFTVRTSRFSMGNDLRVGWTDGPTTKQVDAVADKYSGGSFDGMEDIYNYSDTPWTDAFGSAKFVSTCRSDSDEAIADAIAALKSKYNADIVLTVEDYKMGRAWQSTPMSGAAGEQHWSWQSMIGRKLAETAR
jgi:hypothetical protein